MSGRLHEIHRTEAWGIGRNLARSVYHGIQAEAREQALTERSERRRARRELTHGTIATAEDIAARMREQNLRYLELERAGGLTPRWDDYGKQHGGEIDSLRPQFEISL